MAVGGARRWTQPYPIRIVTAAVLLYLFGALGLDWIAETLAVPIESGLAVVLPFGFVFGMPVALGAGIGAVLEEVIHGTAGFQISFIYVAVFLAVFVGTSLWTTLRSGRRFDGGLEAVPLYVLATVPAVTTMAAVTAWGAELLVRVPFSIAFEHAIVGRMISSVTVGTVAFLVFQRVASTGNSSPTVAHSEVGFSDRRVALLVGTIPVFWGVVGTGISAVFQPLQLETTQGIVIRFGRLAATVVELAGPAGRNLQLLVGVVCGGVLLILLFFVE